MDLSENIVPITGHKPFSKIPAGIHTIQQRGRRGLELGEHERINYFLARYKKRRFQEIKNVTRRDLFFKAGLFDKNQAIGEVPWISSEFENRFEELIGATTPRAALFGFCIATIERHSVLLKKGRKA